MRSPRFAAPLMLAVLAASAFAQPTDLTVKNLKVDSNIDGTKSTLSETSLGSLLGIIAGTTLIPMPLGSASAPGLYFAGDSNTGLWSSGADILGVTTGGANRLTISSSGFVVGPDVTLSGTLTAASLGTVSPAAMLGRNSSNVLGNVSVVPVGVGGTGQASNLTAYGVIVAASTSAMASTAAGVTGQPLLGSSSANPAFGALNLAGGSSIVIGVAPVPNGGTGQSTFTANGLLYGAGTSAVGVTGAGTSGQPFLAGSPPAAGALNLAGASNVTGLLPDANIASTITRDSELAVVNSITPTGGTLSLGGVLAATGAVLAGDTGGHVFAGSTSTGIFYDPAFDIDVGYEDYPVLRVDSDGEHVGAFTTGGFWTPDFIVGTSTTGGITLLNNINPSTSAPTSVLVRETGGAVTYSTSVPVGLGGTGTDFGGFGSLPDFHVGGVVYAAWKSAPSANMASTAAGTSGQALISAGASAPAFGAVNLAGGSGIVTGVLPAANIDTSLVRAGGTLWKDWCVPAVMGYSNWTTPSLTGLQTSTDGHVVIIPLHYEPGTVITKLRVKYDGAGSGTNGVKIKLVKTDYTSATTQTTVDSESSYTSAGTIQSTKTLSSSETMTANYAYSIIITSIRAGSGSANVYGVGVETTTRVN